MQEIGPYGEDIRFDVVDVNRRDREIKIFEIKTSRNDFLRDDKWEKYLDYCEYFAFVCPKDVIKESELPEKIGLVYIEECNKETDWKINLRHEYIKRSFRLRDETNLDNYTKVLEQIASRRANNKY